MPENLFRPPDAPHVAPDREGWGTHGTTDEWGHDERSWPDRRPGFDPGLGDRPHAVGRPPRRAVAGWPRERWTDRTYAGEPQLGPYRGRGPRGWHPSDERLLEDVNEALIHDSFVDASDVEVAVTDAEVTLRGTVTSRAQKRRAEECVEQVDGVVDVHNRLRVQIA